MKDGWMPKGEEVQLAKETWARYRYVRDNGHKQYIDKDEKCKRFVKGDQWDEDVKQTLKEQKRPALTINQTLKTLKTVLSQHIHNRAEISVLPVSEQADESAEALTKVLKHIWRNNLLDWTTVEVVMNGLIGGRGFYELRLDFTDSMMGELRVGKLNPKNVMIDPDAVDYDPDTWNDVLISKWLSAREIEQLYGKEKAQYLSARAGDGQIYAAADNQMLSRDRMSGQRATVFNPADGLGERFDRYIRVIERQYREQVVRLHFVNPTTGDTRPVPQDWDKARVDRYVAENGVMTVERAGTRIKWVVAADNVILKESWSPFEHFTVVPYFPVFLDGYTIGMVEHLIDPQELLNKVTSQELHVVNTTANSGWIFKTGTLVNMNRTDLEETGAQTGLVIEVSEDIDKAISKITANAYPAGLDRLGFKADQYIKDISNVTDSMLGQDREDVAAKAISMKSQRAVESFALEFDNLARTLTILGRNLLDAVQTYYTEQRVVPIIADEMTQQTEFIQVNQPQVDGESGEVHWVNDLTTGEYRVAVALAPSRDLIEDSEFEQAARLREMGVPIPDDVLIRNSRLRERGEIIKQMQAQAQSPEAQEQAQLQAEMLRQEVEKLKAEVEKIRAESQHKVAKAEAEDAKVAKGMLDGELAVEQAEREAQQNGAQELELEYARLDMDRQRHEMEMRHESEKHAMEMGQAREKQAFDAQQAQLKMHTQQQASQIDLQTKQAQSEQQIAAGEQQLQQGAAAFGQKHAQGEAAFEQKTRHADQQAQQQKKLAAQKPVGGKSNNPVKSKK